MKRTPVTILLAVILYVISVAALWTGATALAREKTIKALREARTTFARVSEDGVDNVLWYSSCLVLDEIGDTPRPLSVARMKALASQHHLDELNIIDASGRVIASNFPETLGFDFRTTPQTAEFLPLLDRGKSLLCYGQSYRPSVSNTNLCFKYYGTAFGDRSGFVQVGFSLSRIIATFSRVPAHDYARWKIGIYGNYVGVVRDGDGFVDRVSSRPRGFPDEGVIDEVEDARLGHVFRYEFPYMGMLFRAIIPTREFHEQRNRFMIFGSVSLALLLAIFSVFAVRMSASSEKLAALHRAEEERTASDLAVARVIQMSSLPHADFFRLTRLDTAFDAVTHPAREVGGDFYSFFELSDKRVVFLVADVSGKGVPAAMFMHIALNAMIAGFHVVSAAEEAVVSINNYLCDHNEAGMFVTAWFGVLDPATGEVEYVNAGHNRPYVVRKDGRVERVDARGGLFLGLFPKRAYRSSRLKLESGDRLFLYTDGVTEAMDRDSHPYGEVRLRDVLAKGGSDLCKAVKADIDAHVAESERSDDLTMLELAWYGVPPRVERTFGATAPELGQAVEFLRGEIGLSNASQTARLLNAVDELMSNIVNYAGVKEFTLAVENIPRRCRVTISDAGSPCNPLTQAEPDTHVPLERREVGGLGILMARKLVNAIDYRRENDRNVLTLVQVDFNAGYRGASAPSSPRRINDSIPHHSQRIH